MEIRRAKVAGFGLQVLFIVLATLAWIVFLVSLSHAHEWYSSKRDPVTGGGCCGGADCAKLLIEPGVMDAEEAGYRIRLTAEQAARLNPARKMPVDTLVPWDRIQPSEDGNFHMCIPTYPLDSMRADFFCFFAPPET